MERNGLDMAPLAKIAQAVGEVEIARFENRLTPSMVDLLFKRVLKEGNSDAMAQCTVINEIESALFELKKRGARSISSMEFGEQLKSVDINLVFYGLQDSKPAAVTLRDVFEIKTILEGASRKQLPVDECLGHLNPIKRKVIAKWLLGEVKERISYLSDELAKPNIEARKAALNERLERLFFEVLFMGLDPVIRINIEDTEQILEIEKSGHGSRPYVDTSGIEESLKELKARALKEREPVERRLLRHEGAAVSYHIGRSDSEFPAS